MKIGFFIPNATFDLPGSPEVGGIETFSFVVGEALQRMGHDVVIYGGKPKKGHRHRDTSVKLELFDYLETSSIPNIGTRFQRLVQRLHFGWKSRKSWLDERFDAAILAKPFDWPVAWHWKKHQPKIKTVMGFHGTDFFACDKFFYSAIDRAFAVSPQVADLAEKRIGKRPELISNPVDVDFFTSQQNSNATSANTLRIAASGRLVGWKGFHVLLEAVAKLKNNGVNIEVDLAGEGPERQRLEQLSQEAGIKDIFHLHGRLTPESLRAILRDADLYAAPSIGMEAFSISALEAASTGLPLVLSDQIGLSAYLTKEDFLSYPARDSGALATTILEAAQKRKETGWADRKMRHQRIREQFAPEATAARILELIKK